MDIGLRRSAITRKFLIIVALRLLTSQRKKRDRSLSFIMARLPRVYEPNIIPVSTYESAWNKLPCVNTM